MHPGYAGVLYAQLHSPAAGLHLPRIPLHQHDPLPVQLPVLLCGTGHGLPGVLVEEAAPVAGGAVHGGLPGAGRLLGPAVRSGISDL